MKSRNFETPFISALRKDKSLPIADIAVEMWLKDLKGGFRWAVMPLLRVLLSGLLMVIWFFKRLIPFQFSSHKNLQKLICWFCEKFVTPEANYLILRHFWTESNILNFLIENDPNAKAHKTEYVDLYPRTIKDMMSASFVDHDGELFRYFNESTGKPVAKKLAKLSWNSWREIDIEKIFKKKWTQKVDFETSHVLFMCIFCLFLTADEYRAAINGFNLDQSIAIRAGAMIGDDSVVEYAYNKFPLYLDGPIDLTRRFILHGFFTEFAHERLLEVKENK